MFGYKSEFESRLAGVLNEELKIDISILHLF